MENVSERGKKVVKYIQQFNKIGHGTDCHSMVENSLIVGILQ